MRFLFIRALRIHHVRRCAGFLRCRGRVLQVARSSARGRVNDDAVLTAALHTGFWRRAYGALECIGNFGTRGRAWGRKRVARLMRAADIRAKAPAAIASRPTRTTTRAPVAPNLLDRQFAVAQQPGPDRVWVGRHHLHPDAGAGLYLAILLDLATRIVGWSVRSRLDQAHARGVAHGAAASPGGQNILRSGPGNPALACAHQAAAGRDPGFSELQVVEAIRWDNAAESCWLR